MAALVAFTSPDRLIRALFCAVAPTQVAGVILILPTVVVKQTTPISNVWFTSPKPPVVRLITGAVIPATVAICASESFRSLAVADVLLACVKAYLPLSTDRVLALNWPVVPNTS